MKKDDFYGKKYFKDDDEASKNTTEAYAQ